MFKRVATFLADPDFRAFIPYLARHPGTWRFPKVIREEPPYLGRPPNAGVPKALEDVPAPTLGWGNLAELKPSRKLKLAGGSLTTPGPESVPWNHDGKDPETLESLHRFAWIQNLLLEFSEEGTCREAAWDWIHLMVDGWMRFDPSRSCRAAWEPYTVSERICNMIIAAQACGMEVKTIGWLSDFLSNQAEFLRENLEYYGEEFTGNHLSNNGRALYLAGLALGRSDFWFDGKEILLTERKRIIDSGGMLREGSSHYQFLVSRNYCEAVWFSNRFGDLATANDLKSTLAGLIRGCRFFLVNRQDGTWDIPLIGDISPDCAPEWLLGVPWVGAALCGEASPPGPAPEGGWRKFFPADPSGKASSWPPSLVSGEWARLESGDWSVFAHIDPEGYLRWPGHAHQDTGAIAAFFRGEQVLLDAGRMHYIADDAGQWGISGWGHCGLLIDGRAPGPTWRRFYPKEFLLARAGSPPRLKISKDGFLSISHTGFGRISGASECLRVVAIDPDGDLRIHDSILGRGSHEISLVFHLPEGSLRSSGRISIETPQELDRREVSTAPNDDDRFGWACRRYGEPTPITSLVVSGRVDLPWEGATRVRIRS